MKRTLAIGIAVVSIASAALLAMSGAGRVWGAPVICEKFGSVAASSSRYIIQNNVWGADTPQCIKVKRNGGFEVTRAGHNSPTNGPPAAYPAVYVGCHYARCSEGSNLPMQATSTKFDRVRTSVGMSYPNTGTWNATYDMWFDPTPRTDGQNRGAEIMVWLNRKGSIQPTGSHVGTAKLAGATWHVWFGNVGWNVVSYVRTSGTSSLEFTVDTFYSDAVSRGYAKREWYLTSIQAGFEEWVGGEGLTVNSFSHDLR